RLSGGTPTQKWAPLCTRTTGGRQCAILYSAAVRSLILRRNRCTRVSPEVGPPCGWQMAAVGLVKGQVVGSHKRVLHGPTRHRGEKSGEWHCVRKGFCTT